MANPQSEDFASRSEEALLPSQSPPLYTSSDSDEERRTDDSFLNSLHDSDATVVKKPHRWNETPRRTAQVIGTMYCFIVLGMNDAAIGPLIPWLEPYYHISYGTISLAFLAPVLGYITSALLNDTVHHHFGHRGVAFVGAGCRFLGYVIMMAHPPFWCIVIGLVLAGSGNGLSDGGWNAWVGGMDDANELLGVLHGFYGLGGMLSPVLATALVTKAGWMWYQYYDIMSLLALIEIVFLVTAFWTSDGAHYRATHGVGEQRGISDAEQALLEQDEDGHNTGHVPESTPVPKHINNANANLSEVLKNKVTWIISLFLIAYVGVEVALGGWITTYMLRVRHGSPFAAGLATTGFWTGITVGRVVLGFVTPRYFPSIKEAVVAYLVGSIAFQMVFWLIPSFMAGAFSVFWLGFFIGPLFPAAVLAATGLLEARLHVSAIGFMAALGASGATIAPFLVGAIAEFAGSVKVLQPVVLICLLICLGFWCALPSLAKKK